MGSIFIVSMTSVYSLKIGITQSALSIFIDKLGDDLSLAEIERSISSASKFAEELIEPISYFIVVIIFFFFGVVIINSFRQLKFKVLYEYKIELLKNSTDK